MSSAPNDQYTAPSLPAGASSLRGVYLRVVLLAVFAFALWGTVANAQPVLDEEAQRQLADGLYSRGMYALAAAEYEGILEQHPESDHADACRFRMGECYRGLGNVAKADQAYRKVFNDYPDSEFRFRAGFQRANVFLGVERPQSAIDLFNALLEKKPPADIASASLFFQGEAYLVLEQEDGARKAFQSLVDTYKGSEYYAYGLLKLSALLGGDGDASDAKKAIELLELARKSVTTDRVRAETLFQLAERYFEMKDYARSAPLYQSLIKEFPDDERSARARLRAAWASHNAGRFAEALATALAATDIEEVPDWLYLKANCERQLGRTQDAAKTYVALLKAFPEGSVADAARYELALTYYRQKEYALAVDTASALTGDAATARDALWLKAESYAALGRTDDAVEHYLKIIQKYPDSETACDANYRVAYQLQSSDNPMEASRYYMKVVETCLAHALADQALYAAGHCLASVSNHIDAVAAWTTLLNHFGTSEYVEESLYRKGMSEIHLERNDAAMVTLRLLMKNHPKTGFLADAHYWTGMLLLKTDKLQDAGNAFKAAVEAKPRDDLGREAQYQRAVVLYLQKKHDEAAALLQPLLETPIAARLTPSFLEWLSMYRIERKEFELALAAGTQLAGVSDNPQAAQLGWCLVARCHLAAERPAEAATAYEKALEVQEGNLLAAEAAHALGNARIAANNPQSAIDYYAKAARWAQSANAQGLRARSYLGLGRAHKSLQQRDEAVRFFMSVAVLYDDPEVVPECLFSSAEIYVALGQPEPAQKAMDELRERYPDSDWAKRSTQEAPTP